MTTPDEPRAPISLQPIAQVTTNDRTTYWLDLWDAKARLYQTHPLGFRFWTPQIALDILTDPSTNARTQGTGLRLSLLNLLRLTAGRHPLFRSNFLETELNLLIRDLENGDIVLIAERAAQLKTSINSPAHSNRLIDALASLLEVPNMFSSRDLITLEILTSDVMGRLFYHGFMSNAIAEIPRQLFSRATADSNGNRSTHFPKHFLRLDEHGRRGDRRAWTPLTVDEGRAFDALTTTARLRTLADYMHVDPVQIKCIFGIEGLRGSSSQRVGPVLFYPPAKEPQLPGASPIELMGQPPELDPINASVEVLGLDDSGARARALQVVEAALDILNLPVPVAPTPAVRRDGMAIVNPNSFGLFAYQAYTPPNPQTIMYTTKDLSELATSTAEIKLPLGIIEGKTDGSGIVRELTTSLHWLRRASEATKHEDRLLFSWLAFEKLFVDPRVANDSASIYSKLIELCPSVDAYIGAHGILYAIRHQILAYFEAAIARRYSLRFGAEAYQRLVAPFREKPFREFVANIRRELAFIQSQQLRDILSSQIDILDSPRAAYDFLADQRSRTEQEMSIIYWLRNRLVHTGSCEFKALDYYVSVLESTVRLFVLVAADERNWPAGASHPLDVFRSIFVDCSRLLRDLKEEHGTLLVCLDQYRRLYFLGSYNL